MAEKPARKRILWSKEPDEAPDYSDWKITLTKKEAPSSAVNFSVHRHMVGPSSEYFTKIFKSSEPVVSIDCDKASSIGASSESSNQHSRINFPSNISDKAFGLIVKAFETLLDYCYKDDEDFKGTSPVSLLFMCDYFQMEGYFKSVVEKFSDTVFAEMASQTKLHLLYEEIIQFRAAGLSVKDAQTTTSKLCYVEKNLLLEGSPLAGIADLPLWINVVSLIQQYGEKQPQSKIESKEWSLNISNFLGKTHIQSKIDSKSFKKLTSDAVLPYVDENATLVFLSEENKHGTFKRYEEEDKDAALTPLSSLQNRCVQSLGEANLELDSKKELRKRATRVMYQSPNVMRVFLDRTLDAYGEEKKSLVTELELIKKQLGSKGAELVDIIQNDNPLEVQSMTAFPTVPTADPNLQTPVGGLPIPPMVNQVPRRTAERNTERRAYPGGFFS